MNTLPSSKSDLEPYRKNEQIVRETAEQLIKDFALFGMNISFTGNFTGAYNELFEQAFEHICKLIEKDYPRLLNLLYQIDISESKIKKKLTERPDLSLQEVITHLILDRELLKVLTRTYFRDKARNGGIEKIEGREI